MLFSKLIKNFGKINSAVLFICIILLLLEFAGHRHGEFKIEEVFIFPCTFWLHFMYCNFQSRCGFKINIYER